MTTSSTFKVYRSGRIPFYVNELPYRTEPLHVLMCSPEYFDIVDVKNVHMEGNAGNFDKSKAVEQWNQLHSIYKKLREDDVIKSIEVISGEAGCEDMVFCANQTFPWLSDFKEKLVWMSKMRHPSRQREVPFFEAYFRSLGYTPLHFKNTELFEGMGDTIPHPGRKLVYGGYGHRTKPDAYNELSEAFDLPVIALELINENFYHLDTCFVPLSETEVMLCPAAFTQDGLSSIRHCFESVYEIPESEAVSTFCLNAHAIHNPENGKKAAILQAGSKVARQALIQSGYSVYETDTSEFMKSGGSVFCMKMMYY